MTREELLEKLNTRKTIRLPDFLMRHYALLAVIKLHKPEAQEHGQYEKCWNCNLLYPCPTIQAIEKELT